MAIIYHITLGPDWHQAQKQGEYRADSLAAQGFIHCSTAKQVIPVANTFYQGQAGLLLLCIDTDKIKAEVRYEPPDGPQVADSLFPHIYGPLNPDAVIKVVSFEPGPDGYFQMPETARSGGIA
jgi:uncharacterized protein (DUF952 family)